MQAQHRSASACWPELWASSGSRTPDGRRATAPPLRSRRLRLPRLRLLLPGGAPQQASCLKAQLDLNAKGVSQCPALHSPPARPPGPAAPQPPRRDRPAGCRLLGPRPIRTWPPRVPPPVRGQASPRAVSPTTVPSSRPPTESRSAIPPPAVAPPRQSSCGPYTATGARPHHMRYHSRWSGTACDCRSRTDTGR